MILATLLLAAGVADDWHRCLTSTLATQLVQRPTENTETLVDASIAQCAGLDFIGRQEIAVAVDAELVAQGIKSASPDVRALLVQTAWDRYMSSRRAKLVDLATFAQYTIALAGALSGGDPQGGSLK